MQLILDILPDFVLYVLIAFGFSMCYRILGFFHMAHAVALTLGAYMVYASCVLWAIPLWLSVLISVCFGSGLMFLINRILYSSGEKRNIEGWKLMIVSLGVYVVFQNVISMIWGDGIMTFRTWMVKPGRPFMGGVISNVQIITIVIGAILLFMVWLLFEKTNFGMRIKAVSSNSDLSSILGVSREAAVAWSVAIGTGMMACAGILIAADTDMTPTMGFNWLMYGVVAMIIGGMGKMRHMILGALLLATAQQLSAYFFDSKWMNATAYIILVVFLYFRPYGFSGKRIKKTEV